MMNNNERRNTTERATIRLDYFRAVSMRLSERMRGGDDDPLSHDTTRVNQSSP